MMFCNGRLKKISLLNLSKKLIKKFFDYSMYVHDTDKMLGLKGFLNIDWGGVGGGE